MAQGGRGLRFSVFGFGVRIDWSFFVIALLFGLMIPTEPSYIVVWMLVIAASVLVHELGHAFAARGLGADPSIVIHGMGGWTAYQPTRTPTRGEAIGVALAGPLAGACLGLFVLFGRAVIGEPEPNSLADVAVQMGIWINIGWGLINLAPVLPLDGGQVLEQLMPGGPAARRHKAAWVSIAIGAIAAFVLLERGITFGAILVGLFVMSNISIVRRSGDGLSADTADALERMRRGDPAAVARVADAARRDGDRTRRVGLATIVVEHHLAQGDIDAAEAFAREVPDAVPPPLVDLIGVHRGRPDALARLRSGVMATPDSLTVRCAVHGHLAARRADELAPLLAQAPDEARRLGVLRDAQLRVHHDRSYEAAAELGRLLLAVHPDAEPTAWYNVACSVARAGRPDEAMAYLSGAVERGWRSGAMLDDDPDLATVRARPGWGELRGVLH